MDETMTLQGREITKDNIELVQRLIEANPSEESHPAFQRVVPSVGLACVLPGQIKDMACRTLLSKLELQGYITLPRRRSPGRGCRKVSIPYVLHNTASIACSL